MIEFILAVVGWCNAPIQQVTLHSSARFITHILSIQQINYPHFLSYLIIWTFLNKATDKISTLKNRLELYRIYKNNNTILIMIAFCNMTKLLFVSFAFFFKQKKRYIIAGGLFIKASELTTYFFSTNCDMVST